MMEMAMPDAMESMARWTGGKVVSAHNIHQHKPPVQLDDNNNDPTTDDFF